LEIVRNLLPNSSECYSLLGSVYLKAGDPKAVDALRKATELDPTAETWENLRQALAANGRAEEAVALFGEKVDLNR
jgi:tetratricopeptide (TPR) repeat protein